MLLFTVSGRLSYFLRSFPSLPTWLTLCNFFSWLHSEFRHRRYCIAAFLTVPWLGLCFRVSDIWTADLALLYSSFLHCLCFGVLIVLVSPALSVLPPEVLRACSLPLKVVWCNSYQCILMLCCGSLFFVHALPGLFWSSELWQNAHLLQL